MNTTIVRLRNLLLSFCLFIGSLFVCFSCSSSDDDDRSEEVWTSVDRTIIDKYKGSRMLMGTVWGWKENEHEYDGQHYVYLYADKTCRYMQTIGNNQLFSEGVWEYNPETNRLITTTRFPKLTLKIFSPRDMSGYTDDGKLINVTIPNSSNSNSLENNKFLKDDTTFDFLVGKWENKSTSTILTIHANGEYQIKNHNIVDNGVIDKWSGGLLLKKNKLMLIGMISGSLMEMRYLTNLHFEGERFLYDEINELSGSYEYVIDD